jgi:hypothetical protein
MTTDQFWQIVESTQAATKEEQLEHFQRELSHLPAGVCLSFGVTWWNDHSQLTTGICGWWRGFVRAGGAPMTASPIFAFG